MRHLLLAAVLSACSTVPADRSSDAGEALEALEARVEALEARADQEADETTGRRRVAERRAHREHRRSHPSPMRAETVEVRQTLDELIRPDADRLGRALAHRGDAGALDGYRVSAIRPGTPLDQLGLQNGDIVHAINGVAITSQDAILEAWTQVREQTELQVQLTRQGEPVQLWITVRP